MHVAIDTDFLVRLSLQEHPGRARAEAVRDRHLDAGDAFALAPQVVAEFIHVVTDPRCFERPLGMDTALERARTWWDAPEVVHLLPTSATVRQFLDAMAQQKLGRKRVLDTLLASACLATGLTHLITGNPDDYRLFPGLQLIKL